MGFMDDLKARQAQRTALAPPAPPVTAPTPPADPPFTSTVASSAAVTPAPAPPTTVRELLAQTGAGAAINPPPFAPPPAAQPTGAVIPSGSWVGGPVIQALRRGRGRAKAEAPVPPPAPTTQQVIDTVGTAVGQSAARAISSPPPAPAAPGPQPGGFMAEPGPRCRTPVVGPDGYVLCVNCAPMGADIVMFSRYAGQVHEALKATKGCELYTMLSFEGTALYQDALAQLIDQAPPQGYLVVDTRTNEGRDAISILERGATSVIRGF